MKRAITPLFLLFCIPFGIAAQEVPKETPGSKTVDKSTSKPSTLKLYDVPTPKEFGGQSEEEVAEYVKITKSTSPKEQADLIEAFVKRYPQSQYNPPLSQLAAEDYQRTSNYEKLIEYGEKSLESSPNNGALLAVLTITYATRGEIEKAIDRGTKAASIMESLEPSPNSDTTVFTAQRNRYLAITYAGLGTAFLSRYEKAKSSQPMNQAPNAPIQTVGQRSAPGATESPALPAKTSEDSKTAATEKTPAVSADAPSLDLSKAKGYFSRALELDPDYEFAEFQTGMVLANDRQVAPSLEAFAKVMAMGGPLSALAKENFERIYKITHKNSLEGSQELLDKAKSAWAERKQTAK
jgi:tetratricopeptide (TPR) repeat protein